MPSILIRPISTNLMPIFDRQPPPFIDYFLSSPSSVTKMSEGACNSTLPLKLDVCFFNFSQVWTSVLNVWIG